MNKPSKKYWKSIDELHNTPEFVAEKSKEFGQDVPVDELADLANNQDFDMTTTRRDFLKVFGFSISAATLAACTKTPVRKAIPLLNQPEDLSPSIPNYYASTFDDGHDYAAIVIKTREGRPIRIDGNNLSAFGGTNARIQASVLGLYDTNRLQEPIVDGKKTDWKTTDQAVVAKLNQAAAQTKNIRIVTPPTSSPSTKSVVDKLIAKYPTAKHIAYNPIGYSAIVEANKISFGKANIPAYDFSKASVIVGIGADFLGNWILPTQFTRQYAATRRLDKQNPKMSKHIQFESWLSLTGSNADKRITHKPSQEGILVANLYNEIAALAGQTPINITKNDFGGSIKSTAKELWAAKNNALVVCGSNDVNTQIITNAINNLLGSYTSTIDLNDPLNLFQTADVDMQTLVNEMNAGQVDVLILADVNPAYDYPQAKNFVSGIAKVNTSITLTQSIDETAKLCKIIAPTNHYLESWNDSEPRPGTYTLSQPAISPLYNTRSYPETLLAFLGDEAPSMYNQVRSVWSTVVYAKATNAINFEAFWRKSLHDGLFQYDLPAATALTMTADLNASAAKLSKETNSIELTVYQKVGLGNGSQANNPWLQELPDPISRACWDNYLAINKTYADTLDLQDGAVVNVEANGYSVQVPVLIQAGQKQNVVALALGYGRTNGGKVADGIGVNAFGFQSINNGSFQSFATDVKITPIAGMILPLAQTQTHHTIEGRNIVKETTLANYIQDKAAGNIRPNVVIKDENGKPKRVHPTSITLWHDRKYESHHWAMSIDLNACTGCGACVVSCQAENNVPVVGKKEVINRREMHWIRIDRYYSFKDKTGNEVTKEAQYDTIENYEDVEVVFQPLMCQQCDNAPCETVCPVLATVHSDEGINQMIYNRCVGTRYCANNCPYKVRRFNWFSYIDNTQFTTNPSQDTTTKMVLNPDVTVRARGVMEKCNFCIQRIQAGKLEGKRQGHRPKDGSIQTACQTACPANAIVFGDLNDENAEIRLAFQNERGYGVIEEINVLPKVSYWTKVRNV